MNITNKPMMSDKEIKIIDGLLREHQPASCLEWGSGASTVHFSRHSVIKSWLAIEHNGHYVSYLSDKISPKVNVIWVDKEWYIDCVKLGKKYDFILIDGEQRELCLKTAFEILKPGGIILLHDSGRFEYQSFINKYPHKILSEGEIPDKGGFAHRGLTLFGDFNGS